MNGRITAKVYLSLLAALVLALVIGGCGGGQPRTDERPAASGARDDQTDQRRSTDSTTAERTPGDSGPARDQGTQRMAQPVGPVGDVVEIRRSWVQVRTAPNNNARAVALVFGNDQLEVIEQQGEWVHVRLDKRRQGWIPATATVAEPRR